MLTEVDLKRKNKYSVPCPRHHLNSKKIPEISEIKLSLPYSKVVPKYFIRSYDFFFFFGFFSQIVTTKPASNLVCLFVLPQTQVLLFSF